MMELVRKAPHQVTRCWHPAPRGELVDLGRDRMAQVLVGEPAYQMTDGRIVKVLSCSPRPPAV